MVQLIVSGMTGSSVIALSHVQEETEQISGQKKSQLNMGVMHVKVKNLFRKAVTFKNAQVINSLHHCQPL